jgi:hypothetical protein
MILPPPFTKLARSSSFERGDAPIRRMRRIDVSLTEIESDYGIVRVCTRTLVEIELGDVESDPERATTSPGW